MYDTYIYTRIIEKITWFNRTYGIMYDTYIHCTYVQKILHQLPSVGLAQARPNELWPHV